MFHTHHGRLTMIIVGLVHITYCMEDEAVRTLHKILLQDGWGLMDESEYVSSGLNTEKLRVQFQNKMMEPVVNDKNAETIAITMYNALGCKFFELTTLIIKMELKTKNDWNETRKRLSDINRILLKVVNGLFNLAELFPNILSLEPGALRTALSLNLHLNRVIADFDPYPLTDQTDFTEPVDLEAMHYEILAMINITERFVIANCKPVIKPFLKNGQRLNSAELVAYLEHLLDVTGLVRLDYNKYDVMACAPSLSDGPNRFSVIHYVSNTFSSLLELPFDEGFTFMYFSDVFQHQNMMYGILRLVIHSKTLTYLEELNMSRNSTEPELTDDNYLGHTNIQKYELVTFYQRLLNNAKFLDFPSDIIRHVELMLKLMDAVIINKTVPGLTFFMEHERKNINFIEKDILNESILNILLDRRTISKLNGIGLHMFLKDILSVQFVKYYNHIYKLSKYDIQEVNFVDKFDIVVNDEVSKTFVFIYARCFDIISSVDRNEYAREILIVTFNNILNVLKFISNELLHSSRNFDLSILNEADLYLRYNLLNYPKLLDNVPKIIYSIIYMFTNIIDRFQIIYIKNHKLRDDLFNEVSFSETYPMTDDFDYLSPYNDLLLVEAETKLNNCILFKILNERFMNIHILVEFFWKGQFNFFYHITSFVQRNLFDLYSIRKYIQVFIDWVTVNVSYVILDVIECLLMAESIDESVIKKLNKWNEFNIWPKHCSVAIRIVISRITKLTSTSKLTSFEMMEMKSILMYNLKQYSNTFQRYSYMGNVVQRNLFINFWDNFNPCLEYIYNNKKDFEICKIHKSVNPLVFYLPELFKNNFK